MSRTDGITDSARNPFSKDSWIKQGYGLTPKRRADMEPLFGETCEEILSVA